MDSQTIINVALGAIMLGLGWFARELWDAVKELKSDVSNMREDLPKSYLSKDDWRHEANKIHEMLGKIFDRLEGKVDK